MITTGSDPTTTTTSPSPSVRIAAHRPESAAERARWLVSDCLTLVGRNLGRLKSQPGELLGELIFPAIMIVLFGYVFGSAITVPGDIDYRSYLMPGLFAMTAISGALTTMTLTAADAARGVMDRFRSMPMVRAAVPVGQTGADIVTGAMAMLIMMGCGLIVGWHPTNGVAAFAAGFALLLFFRYVISWGGLLMGLTVSEEAADKAIPLVFPITMISNAFVPTENMPTWLRTLAEWNPVSALVSASRQLFGGLDTATLTSPWPLQHAIVATLLWAFGLLTLFVLLVIRHNRRAAA